MSEKLSMRSIRQQVYLSFSEDGLIDIALGVLLTDFGVLLFAGVPWLVGVLSILPLVVIYLGKQFLTIPRIGSIELAKPMKRRFNAFFIFLIVAGLCVFALFALAANAGQSFFSAYPKAMFGLVLAFGISILALAIKANRLYVYAILTFVAMAVGEILQPSISSVDSYLLAVTLAGVIILACGIIVLVRFLRKYPVVDVDGA